MLKKAALFLAGALAGAGGLWLLGPPGKAPKRDADAPTPLGKEEGLGLVRVVRKD